MPVSGWYNPSGDPPEAAALLRSSGDVVLPDLVVLPGSADMARPRLLRGAIRAGRIDLGGRFGGPLGRTEPHILHARVYREWGAKCRAADRPHRRGPASGLDAR